MRPNGTDKNAPRDWARGCRNFKPSMTVNILASRSEFKRGKAVIANLDDGQHAYSDLYIF
jgi:hypothetical protein